MKSIGSMGHKLKVLSGSDLIFIFRSFDFNVASQKGSHVKLARTLHGEERQILTIPLHDELDRGTLKAIFRQASRYISEGQLYDHFYNE